MVNLDSPFARTIIQTFDEQKINQGIFSSESSEFKKGKELPYEFKDIPGSVRALCSQFTGDMISWFSVTRSLSSRDLSSTCKERLDVLKQKPTRISSYNDQLLQYIFNEVITISSPKIKQKIISLSRNHQPIGMKIHSTLSRLYARMCFIAYAVLRSEIIHACLFISITILFSRAFVVISTFYTKTVFPFFSNQSVLYVTLKACFDVSIALYSSFFYILTLLQLYFLLEKTTNAFKSIHNSTEKALQTKELQNARTLWMQLKFAG